jgi:4-amino-4-deoxy-L-arabinose transferase-like glycosyltransferase
LFGVLTALVVFALALTAGVAAPFAMLAAASFLSLDIFRHLSTCADVDLFACYFVAMCVYGICTWRQNLSDRVAFIISAICLGMAMGTKYLEALHALPIAVFIFYQARSFRTVFFYAFIAALFGLWWYIRSFLMTGNPIHPFAPGIFGYSLWNEEDMISQMRDLSGFMEKSVSNFVTLPRLFNEGQFAFTGMQNWIYGFYLAPLFWTRLSSSSRALMLICWPFLTFWFFSSQTWRYFVPLAPLMLVICFDLLQIIFSQIYGFINKLQQNNLSLVSLQPVFTGLILAFILHRCTLLPGQVKAAGQEALTPQAQDNYLRQHNREYEIISVANRYFDKNHTVYLFSYFDKTYFVKARVLGENFGVYRVSDFSRLVLAASDPVHPDKMALKALMDKFAALHIDGFILDNSIAYDRVLFDREFQRLYSNSIGSIYRIKP